VRPGQEIRAGSEKSAYHLVVTYALIYPLIFFAVRGSFSFEATSYNNLATENFYALVNPDAGKGSAIHSAEMLLCYGLLVMVMLPMWRQLMDACLQNILSFALPVWAILSTVWSQSPKRTLSFAILALVHTIFAQYLPVRFKPKQQMQLFLLIGVIATLGSIALTAVMPRAGVDYKNSMIGVEGLYPHKNICSMVTIALMMPAFFYKFKGRSALLKKSLYLGITMALVLATTSRTGWLVLAGCIGVIFIAKNIRTMKPLERLMTVLFVPGVVGTLVWLMITYRAQLALMMGKDPTLSGRTVIWQAVFLSIFKRPWTGFGYDAFWIGTGEALRLAIATGDPALGNAENGVLQLWLELGLVGVLIVFAILLRATVNAIRCLRSDTPEYALWYMSMIFIAVLSLVDGDKFMYPHAIEWTMLILADAGLAAQAKRIRASRAA
jgi:O-antigen ligase